MHAWLGARGAKTEGPKRELYLNEGPHDESVTELQFPLAFAVGANG